MHALIFANLVLFLSTLSLRRATLFFGRDASKPRISIHALLAESDKSVINGIMERDNFYPRSPCGERHQPNTGSNESSKFLSTLSLRRATIVGVCKSNPATADFYPRSPCGERRVHYDNYNLHCVISIHALLAESDPSVLHNFQPLQISIHALLAESDADKHAQQPTQ